MGSDLVTAAMSRPLILVLALGALGLAACGRKSAGEATGPASIVSFAVPLAGSARGTARKWAPIFAAIRAETGLEIRPVLAGDERRAIRGLQSGKIDAGWFGAPDSLEALRDGGEVFARVLGPNGTDGDTAVLVVNARSPLTLARVLKCDRSLSLGVSEAPWTAGAGPPTAYLFAPRDINPALCFRRLRTAEPSVNLAAVAERRLDVAASDSTLLLAPPGGSSSEGASRVIWRSPLLPQDPLIWRKRLDPGVKEKLRLFFLTYGRGDAPEAREQRRNLASLGVGGFNPADDDHLLPLREIEAGQRLVAAWASHDGAKIAAAKAALAEITARRLALEGRTRTPAAAQ
jgi:phosphonate transport system substrate-binding protein